MFDGFEGIVDIPPSWWIIGLVFFVLLFIILADTRSTWNPPVRGKSNPRTINTKKSPPYTDRGRPVIIENGGGHVKEEMKEFRSFLKHVGGSVLTRQGKMPIVSIDGRLVSWSYRPFREGYWEDFVISGIRRPEFPFWFGEYSLIPNPQGADLVQSPMTLVTSEEDIIRFIGGGGVIRIFSSSQPTFPKFTQTEHGDMVSNQVRHMVKGEEIEVPANTIISVPRGWAYRIKLDDDCIAVLRIPVLTFLSWTERKMAAIRYRFLATKPTVSRTDRTESSSLKGGPKRNERDDDIESVISDDGSVSSSNQSKSQD
jgi:hypothetical protein